MTIKVLILLALCALYLAHPLSHNVKIYGGETAPDGAFPFIVSLRRDDHHICGGSVLGGSWILTAAHCVYEQLPESITVVTGTNDLTTGGDIYIIKNITVHENYVDIYSTNDIALLELTQDVKEGAKVKSIKLDTNLTDTIHPVVLSGWGRIANGSTNYLQYINLTTYPLDECTRKWFPIPLNDKQVCTLTVAGEGACNGDSGGPLITRIEGQDDVLTGVVSWGKPCAVGYPDVFTKVASFVDWINEHIK